jgi:hypothetical protein
MNTKAAFATLNEWIGGTTNLLAGLVGLGVLVELVVGTPVFGVSVVANLVGLVSQFGSNGFAGLLALLILVGLYNKS